MRRSRVLVVAAGLFLAALVVWLRVGWLQLVRHAYYTERADLNQEQRVPLPPVRGQLLDRNGRPLARDLVTYSVSAAPREMRNPHATARDLARALGLEARALERAFAARPRFLWVARRVPPDRGQRVADWGRSGIYIVPETQREYPLGPAMAEILGRTNLDNVGVEGLELQFDQELRGRPGWQTLFRDGRGRTHTLERGMKRNPDDGRSVVLTLDRELQSIVEAHLARAVDTLNAARGFALFLDPRTGEILAAANFPHLPPGRARNWNFTDQFEPGSTYKAVVAGAALEEGVARPDQWFEASATGTALIAPNALFHDVHKQAACTLRDAVRWSSNIVMGRLALLVGSERLYRYSTLLGFGSLTGLSFPGEAGGRLRSPDHWSLRSCPTIAIGHEISVTPLQLALAYAAIANRGTLMQPMIVREIRDAQGGAVRRFSPRLSRRVFSERTARLLCEMLGAVVDSGTARAARVPGLSVAGKTGTAQKYDAAVHTYGRGMYLSSFVGFAPADDPRVVGVVVIDEPRGKQHYGGEVAAPVFREVLLDLRRLPQGPLEDGVTRVAERPPAPAAVTVPDLRMLQRSSVEARLSEFGLRVRFRGQGTRVQSQEPAFGQAVEPGTSVTAWLSAPEDTAEQRLPDLTGMSLRAALRQLTRLKVRAHIEGVGVVARQLPRAGTALPLDCECRLWCAPVMASAVGVDSGASGPDWLATDRSRNGEP
jgi:cell division protein FtsI/penicillin-binding protein 2